MKQKNLRRPIWMTACACMLVLLLIASTAAAESVSVQTGSVTVNFIEEGAALVGAQFDLYQVAEMDLNGKLTVIAPFDQYPVKVEYEDDESWKTLASTLEGYVLRDQLVPDVTIATDEQGRLVFSDLARGAYLIMGREHTQDGYLYRVNPFVVCIPYIDRESGEEKYEAVVSPKAEYEPAAPDPVKLKVLKIWEDEGYESKRPEEITVHLLMDGEVYETIKLNAELNWRYTWEELEGGHHWAVIEDPVDQYQVQITTEGVTYVIRNSRIPPEPTPTPRPDAIPTPTPTPTEDPKLPQTGQIWWPVPALLAGGLLLIVLGLTRRRSDGYEK